MAQIRLSDHPDVVFSASTRNGDTREFLVSSALLCVASPVFNAMFSGEMTEASALTRGSLNPVDLKDDDADALQVVLGILHHRPAAIGSISAKMSLESLAIIVLVSEKYLCTPILAPWLLRWLETLIPDTTTGTGDCDTKNGLALLVLHLLNATDKFEAAATVAIRFVHLESLSTWRNHPILGLLPDEIVNHLGDRIAESMNIIRQTIETVEQDLRSDSSESKLLDVQRECLKCDRKHPANAKQCHPCKNIYLYSPRCTVERRIALYLECLRGAKLWAHPIWMYATHSIQEVVNQMSSAEKHLSHHCEAGAACPLREHMQNVVHVLKFACANFAWKLQLGKPRGKLSARR